MAFELRDLTHVQIFLFSLDFSTVFFWHQLQLASRGDEEMKAARPKVLGGIWVMVFKHFGAWDVLQAGFVAVSLALCPAVGTRAPSRGSPGTWNV